MLLLLGAGNYVLTGFLPVTLKLQHQKRSQISLSFFLWSFHVSLNLKLTVSSFPQNPDAYRSAWTLLKVRDAVLLVLRL